jgi:Uma2 family endonuclease
MQIEIIAQHERHLKRWRELARWPELARWQTKIETDRFGRIVMSPPPLYDHTRYVARIIKLLNQLLPGGEALAETPIVTLDGIKVADAAWISPEYGAQLESQHPVALERAPEICVEVLSPSNTAAEMEEKRALYFEAGAAEVWICDLDGRMAFYVPQLNKNSRLCVGFPTEIS